MGNLVREKCGHCGKSVMTSGELPDERSKFDLSSRKFFCSRKKCKASRGVEKPVSTKARLRRYREDVIKKPMW